MRTFRLAAALLSLCLIGTAVARESTPTPAAFGPPQPVAETWEIQVLDVIADAREIDPAATWFAGWLEQNPPPEGEQLFTVRVRIANTGDKAGQPMMALRFAAVSASEFVYDGRMGCGTVPGQASFMEQLDAGDAIETNLCWRVRTEHVGSLRLRVEPQPEIGKEATAVWFALSEQAATPAP